MNLEILYQIFRKSYLTAVEKNGFPFEQAQKNIETVYRLILAENASPTKFEPFHKRITEPFNYYQFGLDFFRPLIQFDKSRVLGQKTLQKIIASLKKGENAILLANHQTEPDPQVISLLLEKEHPQFAAEMIFVAGHRVITDPFAIPFSKGRNLLCIYSKRYIEQPPELKEEKTRHNRRSLERLKHLLHEGGKCVYVAPAGGRDRKQADGTIALAPFDAASLELFRLIAKGTKTGFYPFAMDTYELFPPPDTVQTELGETRLAFAGPACIQFGEEIDMDHFPQAPADKHLKREARAEYIWNLVNALYQEMKAC